jgi:outer membrane receptor for monomeric catechols
VVQHQYTNHFLMDAKAVWKLRSNLEFTLALNNILNEKRYAYTTYTQLTSFSSSTPIRSRELLLIIYFRP